MHRHFGFMRGGHPAHHARPEDGWGGFRDHLGGGRHGHPGRRGRVFDPGDLKLLILQLISEKPSHGYELIKGIEDRLGGAYSPSPGVVYPTLTLLEEIGLATVESQEGGRKLYSITPEGMAHLEANRAAMDAVGRRMDEARARGGDIPAPVLRAMENLKTALRLKLQGGPLDAERASALAAVLDAAALAVEQG